MNYVQFSLFKWISQNIKIMKMRGPWGPRWYFRVNIHLPKKKWIPCAQLAGTVCPRCYIRSKKASKKALAHSKDHLEISLRPIQATQVTPGPFWTEQKKTRSLWDFKLKFGDLKPIFHWRSAQFTEPLKRLCAIYLSNCWTKQVISELGFMIDY